MKRLLSLVILAEIISLFLVGCFFSGSGHYDGLSAADLTIEAQNNEDYHNYLAEEARIEREIDEQWELADKAQDEYFNNLVEEARIERERDVRSRELADKAQDEYPGSLEDEAESCVIKGNISYNTDEKIYHLPGDEYYDETKINPEYGERWFCSEREAQAAGWRRAHNYSNNGAVSPKLNIPPSPTATMTNEEFRNQLEIASRPPNKF